MLPRNCHIPEELLRSRGTTVPGPSRAPESCGKPRHCELAENLQGLGGDKADLAGKELENLGCHGCWDALPVLALS